MMQTLHGLDGLLNLPRGCIVSVGNYDGVHAGHVRLLETARRLKGSSATPIAVVTFEPHPLTVLRPEMAPPRISATEQKRDLIAQLGADFLVELPPVPEVLGLSAEEFWEMLSGKLGVTHLVEGEDFNFGKARGGNIARLREWSKNSSLQLHVADEVRLALTNLQTVKVRSSLIRWLIGHGRMRDAAICLTRPYELQGQIVKGFQRGRKLGMPTANFECGHQLIPADGVYAGICEVDGRRYIAATSIGTLPTFGDYKRQVEAFLLDFDGDLYGQTLRLQVVDWIRDQMKFPGIQALLDQMKKDVTEIRLRANHDVARPLASVPTPPADAPAP